MSGVEGPCATGTSAPHRYFGTPGSLAGGATLLRPGNLASVAQPFRVAIRYMDHSDRRAEALRHRYFGTQG